jgi:hypothetical protein
MNLLPEVPAAESLPPGGTNDETRSQPDRRRQPTSPWGAFPPAGRRMRNRRADERCRPYFVDRFSTAVLAFILMLLIASLLDAILTIRLIDAGGGEVNPLMNHLLRHGVLPFLLGKYLLTVVGLPVLLIFKNYYLFGTRVRVGYMIPVFVALYAVLLAYQLVLMCRCPGL